MGSFGGFCLATARESCSIQVRPNDAQVSWIWSHKVTADVHFGVAIVIPS